MTRPSYTDEQRLAFGRVAELYDRARPSYPPAAIDALIGCAALTPPTQIVEVGAGTGKATELLAARGLGVLALEPSAEMARVARARCAAYPAVEILEVEFEGWEPHARWPALVSVQAWHWLAAAQRYGRAHEALVPGGTLAAVWTFPDWERCGARDVLRRAYRSAAPRLRADFPMHPDSEPTRLAGDWQAEINAGAWFTSPEVRAFPWSQRYSPEAYTDLLQTHQDHILLPEPDRTGLMESIRCAVADDAGSLELPFVTYVCLARRR